MITKLCQTSLIALLAACSAQAGVYIEANVSHQTISGLPNIGDVGTKLGEDLPSSAFTLTIGHEFTPRVALEARFTDLGDPHVYKLAPSAAVFPGLVGATVMTYYYYDQSTQLYTVALPVNLLDRGRLSLSVAPLLHLEHSKFVFTNAGVNTLLLPGPLPVIYSDTRTELHVGGELKLAYRFSPHLRGSITYSYSALEAYDAHLFGAGLGWNF